MEKFKQYLLATVGLVIFISAATLLYPVPITGAPPAKDVNVVNTPLSVDLASTANVNVVNDASSPVPVTVQNADAETAQLVEIVGTVGSSRTTLFTVPSGKRVIITDVVVSTGGG